MTSRPFYSEYAWAYDFIVTRPVPELCDGIATVFSEAGVRNGARILDAGCGTGSYAMELGRRGYCVFGVDRSPQLIAEARKRTADDTANVEFAVGDFLALSPKCPYDSILCRGVLNDFIDDSLRQEAFLAFARLLKPGGVLLFDVREWNATVERKTSEPVFERSMATERGTLSYRSVTRLDPANRQLLVAERHTLADGGKSVVADYNFIMRCWTRGELDLHLKKAGFVSVTYLKDYVRESPRNMNDRLVVLATAPLGMHKDHDLTSRSRRTP